MSASVQIPTLSSDRSHSDLGLMPDEIKPMIALLKGVGWDYSKSGDLRIAKLPPYAYITITQKNKAELVVG